jgi:hypothetical protein
LPWFVARYHCAFLTLSLAGVVAGACHPPPEDPRRTGFRLEREGAAAQYDEQTGRLTRLELDTTRDGRIDTVTYMDGTRVERIEIDRDGDGLVDRWEYYDGGTTLVRVGTSSLGDGRVDEWSYPDVSGHLSRIERDTTRDGRVDKWEHYEPPLVPGGPPVLRVVELDVEGIGRPTRRLRYHADGSFDRVEEVR